MPARVASIASVVNDPKATISPLGIPQCSSLAEWYLPVGSTGDTGIETA
jgi:hypothetical protein